MLLKDFQNLLTNHSGKKVKFTFPNGEFIDRNFHLTEVKKSKHETIDCGSRLHKWKETIIQIWQAPEQNEKLMTTKKAFQIIDQSDKALGLIGDSTIVFEWGESIRQNLYPIRVSAEDDYLIIELDGLKTSCKARHRYDAVVNLHCCT